MIEKQIPGFPDYYATDCGKIISYKWGKRREMKQGKNPGGYALVYFRVNTIKVTRKVHHLVLSAFVEKPDGAECCRHLDGNPMNNKLSNLKWGTHSENCIDMSKHGTHNNRKLSDEDVRDIRYLLSKNELLQEEIGDMFGVTRQNICKINNRITYKHVI